MKRIKNNNINLIKNARTLATVHTHTHTDSFKRLKNNAIFAFINNI